MASPLVEHALEHGADDVPDLGPALAARAARARRVLSGDDLAVGVVVEHDESGPHQIRMAKRELRQVLREVRRDCGQRSIGPRGSRTNPSSA